MAKQLNTQTLRLVPAKLSDLALIVDIYNETIASQIVTADLEPAMVRDKVQWFESHDPDKHPIWLITDQDQVLGWASLSPFHPRPAYDITVEVSLYLSQSSQGKGIGSWALSTIKPIAQTLGYQNLVGLIFSENQASIRLFLAHGFDVWGELPKVAAFPSHYCSLSILGCALPPACLSGTD